MASSVKPWALAKAVNFSFTSALGLWVRPEAGRRALRSLLCPPPHPGLPPGCGPGTGGARTVETGHVDVLAEAFGAGGAEQGVLVIVRVHHPHVVPAAPVWAPGRRRQSGTLPHAPGLLPRGRGCPPGLAGGGPRAPPWAGSLPGPSAAGQGASPLLPARTACALVGPSVPTAEVRVGQQTRRLRN